MLKKTKFKNLFKEEDRYIFGKGIRKWSCFVPFISLNMSKNNVSSFLVSSNKELSPFQNCKGCRIYEESEIGKGKYSKRGIR